MFLMIDKLDRLAWDMYLFENKESIEIKKEQLLMMINYYLLLLMTTYHILFKRVQLLMVIDTNTCFTLLLWQGSSDNFSMP